ncbi:probable glucokinase [Ceraceosorus bombacis]|uniref:Phosphotransferase n=1 Tax=Ceraceosorus bombacis TaxID=401625 RepID=A0A0P1BEU1_9BASI|nr:probable glucokinase [Ceraceosorus bombacis]
MPSASHPSLSSALASIEEQFDLSPIKLQGILDRFRERMVYGLQTHGAAMAMIPSYVTGTPDGSEKGVYLALDLGGTNLRVCEVTLGGEGKVSMKQEKYKVSDQLKTGPVEDLFDYIASSVAKFLKDFSSAAPQNPQDGPLLMGFTFSFPVEQTAIDRGTLISWTKGFSCPGAVGLEVVQLLQGCLDRQHVPVRVNALVNDTVGALLAHAYHAKGALLGAIFGTGTNGAYVESVERIGKMNAAHAHGEETMIINTEWGGFDDERAALLITLFDNTVDRTAIRPRHHAFEKMISGMYLGEVVRTVLIHLVDSLHLFQGFSSELLNKQYGFDTAYVSAVLADKKPSSSADSPTRLVLVDTLGIKSEHVAEGDVETVKAVCKIVGRRAARLSSVAIAATLQHTGHDQHRGAELQESDYIDIGCDGSVYEFLPYFEEWVREALRDLVGEGAEKRVRMALAKDGSGVGAALCALQAKKQHDRMLARSNTI